MKSKIVKLMVAKSRKMVSRESDGEKEERWCWSKVTKFQLNNMRWMSSGQLTCSVITKLDTPVLYPGALFKRIDLEFAHHTQTCTHTHTCTHKTGNSVELLNMFYLARLWCSFYNVCIYQNMKLYTLNIYNFYMPNLSQKSC